MEAEHEAILVAIFSGFLGSGKTTILQRILPTLEARGEKVCVIVNDLSSDNIDAFAFNSNLTHTNEQNLSNSAECGNNFVLANTTITTSNEYSSSLIRTNCSIKDNNNAGVADTELENNINHFKGDSVTKSHNNEQANVVLGVKALSGGCICCNLLGELISELLNMHREHKYSYVCIECTGVADTTPLITTLASLPLLKGKIEIDVLCTVLHGPTLLSVTKEIKRDEHHIELEECDESKYEVNFNDLNVMFKRQMHGANVILINNWENSFLQAANTSEVLRAWETAVLAFVKQSNSRIRVFFTNEAYIAFEELLLRQRCFATDDTIIYFLQTYAAMNQSLTNLENKIAKSWRLKSKARWNVYQEEQEKEWSEEFSKEEVRNGFYYINDQMESIKETEPSNTEKEEVSSDNNIGDDTDNDDDSNSDEEAFELRLLGIQTLTFCAEELVVSIRTLCKMMSTERGVDLMRDVIRSKGFFDAIDANIGSDENKSRNVNITQFRWQSVNRHFDYGPVLPPFVELQGIPTIYSKAMNTRSGNSLLNVSDHQELKLSQCVKLRCKIVFIGTFKDS